MQQADKQDNFTGIIEYARENLKQELTAVEDLLTEFPKDTSEVINKVTKHIISTGGKRIRAILTLISAKLLDYRGDRHINLAAAIEGIHTATLLHDDVVDESNYRRSKQAAHKIWGNKTSILVGDYLFSKAFKLMTSCNSLECLKRLSNAASIISEGEIQQLTHLGDLQITTEKYFEIIGAKTAELFGVACEISGIISGLDDKICNALYDYGYNLGIIFQIKDDELDYTGSSSTGKKLGADFTEGKLTLPAIIAYAHSSEEISKFWQRTLVELSQEEGDFNLAKNYIEAPVVKNHINSLILSHYDSAIKSLSRLPSGENKTILHNLLDFAINRNY